MVNLYIEIFGDDISSFFLNELFFLKDNETINVYTERYHLNLYWKNKYLP